MHFFINKVREYFLVRDFSGLVYEKSGIIGGFRLFNKYSLFKEKFHE